MTDQKFLALAETTILNIDGRALTLEDLLDDNKIEKVLRFSKGTFSPTVVNEVTPDDRSENVNLIRVTLQGGETFDLITKSRVLTSNNEWVEVDKLTEDHCLKTLTYNPSNRHPEQKLKNIQSISSEHHSFKPVVEFNMSSSDNLLVTAETENSKTILLVPIQPESVAY